MKPKSTIAWTYLDGYGDLRVRCFRSYADANNYFWKTANQKPVKVRITVMPDKKLPAARRRRISKAIVYGQPKKKGKK